MKFLNIAVAKIHPEFFELIKRGIKNHEVRSDGFDNADAVAFLSDVDGTFLGLCPIISVISVERNQDGDTLKLASICEKDYYTLFPDVDNGGPKKLWIAKLGQHISFEDYLEDRYGKQTTRSN